MVRIRLSRTGVKRKPYYRIVAVDERKKRGSVPLEVIGFWHPKTGAKKINKESIKKWVERGAKVTPAVSAIL